jgi:hypothetical protein
MLEQKLTVAIVGYLAVLSRIKHKIWNVKEGLYKIRFQLSTAKHWMKPYCPIHNNLVVIHKIL